jgi:hypothetical protein
MLNETIKYIARARGQVCSVLNCSEQMKLKSLAATSKGLSQTGTSKCHDDINRIATRALFVAPNQAK